MSQSGAEEPSNEPGPQTPIRRRQGIDLSSSPAFDLKASSTPLPLLSLTRFRDQPQNVQEEIRRRREAELSQIPAPMMTSSSEASEDDDWQPVQDYRGRMLASMDNYNLIVDLMQEEDRAYGELGSSLLQDPLLNQELWALSILWAMDPRLIKALLENNVFRTVKGAGMIDMLPVQNTSKDQERPCIYGHFWGLERNGDPPTANQMLYLLPKIEDYYQPYSANFDKIVTDESAKVASLVDSHCGARPVSMEARKNKTRRHFKTQPGVDKIFQWVTDMKKYIKDYIDEEDRDKPIPLEICEIGWALKPFNRAADHSSHSQSSIPLMNLLEDLGHVYLNGSETNAPRPYGKYVMKNYLLMDVFIFEQRSPAEHVISILAGSYTKRSPVGMNTDLGGKSNNSGRIASAGVWEKQWTRAKVPDLRGRINEVYERALKERIEYETYKHSQELALDEISAGRDLKAQFEKTREAKKKNKAAGDEVDRLIAELDRAEDADWVQLREMEKILRDTQARANAKRTCENAGIELMKDCIIKCGYNDRTSLTGDWDKEYEIVEIE